MTPTAWELAHHWTPRLPASLEPFGYHNDWLIPSGTGQLVSNREPGLVFLAAPFYWLCSAAGVGNVIPASAAAALLTAAAAATLSLVARRFVSAEVAAVGALIAGTATTTWAVSGTALWPHGPDQLYLAVSMAGTASGSFAVSGIALAAAILTRPPLAIVAAVTGIWESLARRRWRPALTIGAFAAAGLVVLLSYSRTYWSGGLDSQYAAAGGGFVRPFFDLGPAAVGRFAVNILGTFLSPGRGVLWGAPFLLVLAPGLRPAWRVAPPWVRSAALGGALYLIVQLKGNRFSGGDRFWSYRYPLETLTFALPAASDCLERVGLSDATQAGRLLRASVAVGGVAGHRRTVLPRSVRRQAVASVRPGGRPDRSPVRRRGHPAGGQVLRCWTGLPPV